MIASLSNGVERTEEMGDVAFLTSLQYLFDCEYNSVGSRLLWPKEYRESFYFIFPLLSTTFLSYCSVRIYQECNQGFFIFSPS